MQCFLVGVSDTGRQTALAALADEFGFPFHRLADLKQLKSDPQYQNELQPLIFLSSLEAAPTPVREAIEFAREQSGRGFVVCLADTMAPDDYKRLVRTGSAEWMTPAAIDEEFRELVIRLKTTSAIERAAKVVSFVPSKGGVGNTTLAIEVASYLSTRRSRAARRVAILDLNLQGGTLADALDVEPRFDVDRKSVV